MRTKLTILALALLLASPGRAMAQDPQPNQTRPFITLDMGYRASSIDGDSARFQRYRDLREQGAGINFTLRREAPTWAVTADARNVGYLDQQYRLAAATGRVRISFEWNQTPLFYGNTTSTAYVQASPGVFTLDSAARFSVQGGSAIGIPMTAAQAQTPSIYRALSRPFDLKSRRDNVAFSLVYAATQQLSVKVDLNSYARTGAQPWGGAFSFSALPEVPVTLDNRTTTVQAGAQWTNGKGMLRIGYEGSYFTNNVGTLTWDNPVRATDYNGNTRTATGYDPSGYVTGNGAAQGRMSLAPSNHANGINGAGLLKLPSHSSLNAAFNVVAMNQDEALIPWTSNPVIASAKVYTTYPGLAALPRSSAQADVRTASANVNFSSHPNPYVGLTARYRFFNRDDRTPAFDATDYVLMDAAPLSIGGVSRQLNITRNAANVDATFTPVAYTAFHVGVGRDLLDQTRVYSRLADTTFRASVDTLGNPHLTLRALYEHTRRSASGLDAGLLAAAAVQPASRSYDDASRTSNRGTLVLDLNPLPFLGVNVSGFAGRDVYDDRQQEFGLLNNDNTGFDVGVSVLPVRHVSFGADYGYERYKSLQASRAATGTSNATWTAGSRNWDLSNDEKVKSAGVHLDLIRALPKTEMRFGYDWSASDQGFAHSGPRIDALASIGQFVPLPLVTNTWRRATIDLRYFLNEKVGIGAGYWYDKYDVNDFQTLDLSTGAPRLDYVGSLMLGYGYRPFNANTGFVRVFYVF